jgi:hypothetical protein
MKTQYPAGLPAPSQSLGAASSSLGRFQTSMNSVVNTDDNGNQSGMNADQQADMEEMGALINQIQSLAAKYSAAGF